MPAEEEVVGRDAAGLLAEGGGRRSAAHEDGAFLTGGGAGAGGGAAGVDVEADGSLDAAPAEDGVGVGEGRLTEDEVGVVSSVLGVETVGVEATEGAVVGRVDAVIEDEEDAEEDGTED